MQIFWYLIFLPMAIYLAFNVLYLFLVAIAGRLSNADDISVSTMPGTIRRIAVLIPAYKEDKVIIDSVEANLQLNYPKSSYDLFVIADSFLPETLLKLATYPIKVIKVEFEQSTVQKSVLYALNQLPPNTYDIVMVSDADNHMAPDFLQRINLAFDKGWKVVQGHRVAKNTNTSVAIFDAMNEEVNNHLFRGGQRALGLSASLIGSGMAFVPEAMIHGMSRLQTMGGYDKELEMNLLLDGFHIAYLKEAYIYDEKVQNMAVFERQRSRWIAAQIHFVKFYFKVGIQQLFKGNFHAFNAYVKGLIMPRTLLLAVLGLGVFIGLIFLSIPILTTMGSLLGLLAFSLAISIPGYLWEKISAKDFLTLFQLIFRMVRSLLNIKQAGKSFLPTPHGETETKS
ncbi:glycosyltransferase [Runella sp.]|uniref:glycosyltransferase n=1 Tax=Runella sp. TaxID=1960881 RepID=UPI003D0CD255